MSLARWLVCCLFLIPIFQPGAVAGEAPIPLRDFFRNPEQAAFQVSPDGKTFAFLRPWERRLNIFVQAVGSAAPPRRITADRDRDIVRFFWKGPDRLVYSQDSGGDENFHLLAVGLDGTPPRDLTPFPGVRAEVIEELREVPDSMLIGLNRRDPRVFDAYRLNVLSGELALAVENPGNISAWVADHRGEIRAALTSDGANQGYLYRDGPGQPFRPVLTTSFRETFSPQVFSGDNRRLYALSNLGRDTTALVRVDPATAREEEILYARDDVDLDAVAYSHRRRVLTAVRYTTDRLARHFLDGDTQALFRALAERLPGDVLTIASMTDDEGALVVVATSDRKAGAFYLYERAADRLTPLGEAAPWLPQARLAATTPIQYRARDGLPIHAYLTLPPGASSRPLPLVVNPHGGPWARDDWRFNPEVQFLASRGYAVLQPNFRGSTGYGRRFWEAGFKQWGRAMQDDLTDGVKHLIQEGIADPRRVCIYGASYGGYATLAGLAFNPELYACGVDYVGVSNLFTFLNTIPPYWELARPMFYAMIGDPESDQDLLRAASPALNAGCIRAPVLIAQGANDPRVKIDESDQMVAALKARGIPVEYLVKDHEGHGFLNEENRFDFYEAMERFLANHLQ